MVKNTIGGSKSRGFARKSYSASSSSVVRVPQNILEKFAIVTKLYGQGRCQVITNEQLTLNCIIRNKFKSRFKNTNLVSLHSIILIGLREWEGPDNFKICDLLEVYSYDDITHIRTLPYISFHTFDNINDTNLNNTQTHDHFDFSNNYNHTPLHTPDIHTPDIHTPDIHTADTPLHHFDDI